MVNNAFCTCTENIFQCTFYKVESMVSVLTINELLKLEIKIK